MRPLIATVDRGEVGWLLSGLNEFAAGDFADKLANFLPLELRQWILRLISLSGFE